jgi:hypothetical protein
VFTAAAMPGAGYRVEFFQSGTTTPVTVYTTAALSIAHPSPLVCDANGVFPAVFSAGGAIKAVVTKPDGSSFYTLDPVFRVSTSGAGASEVTFSPTPGLPFTNVQAAIEGAAASAASGFTPFGLGVTGTNALIANLDATNTASGSYRFDNTTTGTPPTGVTVANTGTVQIWRENAGDAVMFLQSGAADRAFFRRMAGSTWGAWQEAIIVPQGAVTGNVIVRGASSWTLLAPGANGQFLRSDGTTVVNASGGYTWLTPVATTSGASFDLTGVPAWATEVILQFSGFRQTAGSLSVQLRTAGAPVTTGYASTSTVIEGAGVATNGLGTGFVLSSSFAANGIVAEMVFKKWPTSNLWNQTHLGLRRGTTQDGSVHGGGSLTLAGALEGVRVLVTGGTADQGSIVLGYR